MSSRRVAETWIGAKTAALSVLVVVCVVGCKRSPESSHERSNESSPERSPETNPTTYVSERNEMVDQQIVARGVKDPHVLAAMRKVPRHELVPEAVVSMAYQDSPLPIGEGQTMSQPYIVAAMTELAEIGPESKVLEIGTGSGYQAAVLAEIAKQVYSIEIVESLGKEAARNLDRLGYDVKLRIGDGYQGWPEAAPFDAILVTAAPPRIPEPLKQQLKVGGKLVIPVGQTYQELLVITRTKTGFERRSVFPVRFVPMTGQIQN